MKTTQLASAESLRTRVCCLPEVAMGVVRASSGPAAGAESRGVFQLSAVNPGRLEVGQRFACCFDYMMAHLDESIRISTLCAMTGYSQSRFYDLFKRVTGVTPLNWFIRARMRWAAEFLESSALPVKQIAWRVGYADEFYFSRLFKSVHGISPREYRAQKKLTGS
jgi:AraC family transcriptional regulator, arabinose operon regulatory protein